MKKVAVMFALVLALGAFSACGSDDDSTTGDTGAATNTDTTGDTANDKAAGATGNQGAGGKTTLKFEADPGGALAYTEDTASTTAGSVMVDFTNPSVIPHDVAIESSDGKTIGATEVITEGSDSTTVELEKGAYTFYCTVPGHREAGMEGDLTAE